MKKIVNLLLIIAFVVSIITTARANYLICEYTQLSDSDRQTEWVKAARFVNHENKRINVVGNGKTI